MQKINTLSKSGLNPHVVNATIRFCFYTIISLIAILPTAYSIEVMDAGPGVSNQPTTTAGSATATTADIFKDPTTAFFGGTFGDQGGVLTPASADRLITSSSSVSQVGVEVIASKLPNRMKGDLNSDGVLSRADASLFATLLSDLNILTASQRRIADADGNNVVDSRDLKFLSEILEKGLTSVPKRGDADMDGRVSYSDGMLVWSYLKGTTELSNLQQYVADANSDGRLTYMDQVLIERFTNRQIVSLPHNAIMGDVDGDGEVTEMDVFLIEEFLEDSVELDELQQAAGDLNNNGRLDQDDIVKLREQLSKYWSIESFDISDNPNDEDMVVWG